MEVRQFPRAYARFCGTLIWAQWDKTSPPAPLPRGEGRVGAPATRTGRGTLRRGGELGDEVPRTERERTIERTAGLWAGTAWAWRCPKPVEEVTGKGAATMAAPSGERGESTLQRV